MPSVRTIIYPTSDLDASKKLFSALLGSETVMDEPYYVQWTVDGQDIGLDPNGHAQGMTGPIGYWHVDDVNATVDSLVSAGATVSRPARDVGGGTLVAVLSDADGNVIGLRQAP